MDDTTSPSVSVVHGEDGEEYGINSARPARIGYVILVAGEGEAHKAKKLLQVSVGKKRENTPMLVAGVREGGGNGNRCLSSFYLG